MSNLLLKRSYSMIDATCGLLIDPYLDQIICLTLEPPWRFNEKNISCIPNGIYDCVLYRTDRTVLGDEMTYRISHVSDRDGILFHIGNTIDDTEGCILTGSEFGILNNKTAVLESRKAFKRFMDWADNIASFQIRIEG